VANQRGRLRDAMRHRDFRRLVAAFLVDQIGSWAYNVVLIVWVFDRTHSATWISATTAAGWVPRLLFSAYAGVLADRYERTTVMLYSALLSFVAMTGVALVVASTGPVALALVFSAIAASFAAAYRPASSAVIPDIVSEQDLVSANAVFGGLDSLVVVLGPGIGGVLLLVGSPAVGITVNALSFLGSALLLYPMRVRSTGDAGAQGESLAAQFGAGLAALRHEPVAVALVAFCYLDSAVYAASTVVFEPLSHQLGTGSNGYSYLIAVFSLGGVLAAPLTNVLSASPRLAPWTLGGIFMLALPFAAATLTDSAAAVAAFLVVSGAGMVIVDVLAITALQRDLPREMLSRVFGIFETVLPAALLASSFITSIILRSLGLTDTLLIIGFGFSAAAILGLPPLLHADHRNIAAVRALRPLVDLLDALDLFAGASRASLERLARGAEAVSLPAGAVVVREGQPADALWVLRTGTVAVSARGEARRARQLRTMQGPSYFGEIGLLRGIPRTATVRTVDACDLLRIDAADFLDAAQGAGVSSAMLARSTARLARSHPSLSESPPTGDVVPEPA
jgi:MFS family permease